MYHEWQAYGSSGNEAEAEASRELDSVLVRSCAFLNTDLPQ